MRPQNPAFHEFFKAQQRIRKCKASDACPEQNLGNDLCRVALTHGGMVSVNTADALPARMPFGGIRQSGHGRDLPLLSPGRYTALKTAWTKYRA